MKGLKHAALPCTDLQRALAFYKNELGFEDYHVANQDWAMLSFRETTLSLVPHMEASLNIMPKKAGSHPAHLGFLAHSKQEVDVLRTKLEKVQGIIVSRAEAHRDGSYGFYFTDTENNQLEFIYIPVTPKKDIVKISTAFVLFAHGSSNTAWSDSLMEMKTRLESEMPNCLWSLAFLERQNPNLSDCVAKLVLNHKIETLNVLPMFLGEGRHVREDIPALVAELKEQYPSLKIQTLKALGSQALVMDALSDCIQLYAKEHV